MPHTLAARLRRLWLDVHLWIGVGLLVLLIPLSVSGAILVWHEEISHAVHPERYAVSAPTAELAPGAYAAAAQAAFAGRATLTQIRLPQEPGDPVVAVGRLAGPPGPGGRPRSLNAWIDPPTGRVLATAEPARDVTQFLHRLHGSLMIPEVGRKVVGWLGWAMTVSTLTGLWLWWPRHGGLLRALRWRRGASKLFNLHHAVGFWLCLPLAVLSLTGVYISFPQTARALFGVGEPPRAGEARPGGRGDPRFAPPLASPRLTLDEAVAAAQVQAPPGSSLSAVNLPQQGAKPAWRIDFRQAGAEQPKQVRVEDASGKLMMGRGGAGRTPDPLSRWMRRIHDGTDLGIVWRSIIFAAGVAPLLLGVTGVVMWLRRRARRLRLRHAAAA